MYSKSAIQNQPRKSLKIRAARRWLQRGAALVALHPSAKNPIERGWPDRPITTQAEIDQLFNEYPSANYGIITGRQSKIVCIDVDGPDGRKSLKALEAKYGKLPPTVTVMTGRDDSYHLYFKYVGRPLRNSAGKIGKNLDFRGDGGYILGVGSIHPNGLEYDYADGLGPNSVEIAELPLWLAEILADPESKPSLNDGHVTKAGDLEVASSALTSFVSEPGRNQHLTRLAGRLRNADIAHLALVEALWIENEQKCRPPLERTEVEKIAESVARYVPKNQTGDEAEDLVASILQAHFASGATLIFAEDGRFWSFVNTHWAPLHRKALEGIVLEAIQAMPARGRQKTASLITQTIALLGAATAARDDVLRFNAPPLPIINCANGELHIQEDGRVQLQPHNPKSHLRNCIPVTYDSRALCPRYDAAVAEIFSQTSDAGAMTEFWHELMGYAIQADRRIPAIILGKGGGSNGKTVLVETAVRLVGKEYVAAMPVQELDKSRFTIGSLLDKLLLIDDDMKAGTRLPDGELKRLSEAKTVTGEHKFGQPFTFTARSLPILLCNNPPSIADLSYGMRRRLIVVPFDRKFEDHEIDTELFRTIWSTEMSGVLNRFLAGLQRVIERGWSFETPKSSQTAKEELLIEANPLPAFIEDRCQPSGSCWLSSLYEAFIDWAAKNGITRPQQKATFKRNLQSCRYEIIRGNQGDKVVGVSLRIRS